LVERQEKSENPTNMNSRNVSSLWAIVAVLAIASAPVGAFHLPGTGPRDYHENELVDVQVNVLTSVNTHLPYDFYSLPFCLPTKKFRGEPENLGEILMGDRIKPSPFENIKIGLNSECNVLCGSKKLNEKQKKTLADRVKSDYHVNLLMDQLPLAAVHESTGTYSVGIPLGVVEKKVPYVYNHLHFTIKYYELTVDEVRKKVEADKKKQKKVKPAKGATTAAPEEDVGHDEYEHVVIRRIISFVAKPSSIKHDDVDPTKTCMDSAGFAKQKIEAQRADDDNIAWSYGVTWENTNERWATRWDVYLNVQDHEIHWFSIINSVLIVALLFFMVAYIFIRTLRRDINQYNRIDIEAAEDLQDETGWKLVHKDVFRPPDNSWVLAALAGTGMQLFGMVWTVLLFACLGFLAPNNRGALFTAMLIFFVFLGVYAGYTSARLLKMWGKPSWVNILLTALLVPGIAFGTFFVVNLAVWSQGSSGAVPFATMIAVIAMWFCISLPLVFVGAVFGFKKETIKLPVATAQIPRHIPEVQWHMQPAVTIGVAGILPFGAVFIEVFFILTAVWLNRYYYVFGFLAIVVVILSLTCAAITIVMTYFQLCAENYQWWWRSFLTSGSCGGYLFVYSVFYFFSSSMRMTHFVPILLYFSYMGLLSFIFFVFTGTVGFMATFAFVRYIYGSIKVD
jgi:transmembrane 9 superfamily protein 2/4